MVRSTAFGVCVDLLVICLHLRSTAECAMAIKAGWTGRVYEDFEVGDVYRHPLGRTITQTDNI